MEGERGKQEREGERERERERERETEEVGHKRKLNEGGRKTEG